MADYRSRLFKEADTLKQEIANLRARSMQESNRLAGAQPRTPRDRRQKTERILGRFFMKDPKTGEKDIEVIYVTSSNLDMVAYSTNKRIMRVKFKSGSTYDYFSVPPRVMNIMKRVGSKGRYHYYNIRMTFAYKRII